MSAGQISIFIIIGILIVVAFSITIYVGGNLKQRIESKPTQARLEQFGIQSIHEYVTTCLTLAAQKGLLLVGRQGGLLFKSQGGLTPDAQADEQGFYLSNQTDLDVLGVPLLVLPPEGDIGNPPYLFSTPPRYPFDHFPYLGETLLFKGYYGISNLSPLYKATPTGEPVPNSIQANLEQYVISNTLKCATWNEFEKKGYRITEGTPNVTLLFAEKKEQFVGEQFVTFALNWPLQVTTPTGDTTLVGDFAARIQVRLATIYYLAKKIIDSDVTDISYVPDTEGTFIITKVPLGDYSFIVAEDQQSLLGRKPMQFWIARKNRRPALWFIDPKPLESVTFHITPEGRGARVRITGNQLQIEDPCQEPPVPSIYTLPLNASDPDEDAVTYDVILPGTEKDELPESAIGADYHITIYAKDQSDHENPWFDFQELPLTVARCPVH